MQRDKFLQRLAAAHIQPRDLVTGCAALATVVPPAPIAPVVLRDPDDDAVIACAVAAAAVASVSGDRDLLILKKYQASEIVKAAEFLARIRQG